MSAQVAIVCDQCGDLGNLGTTPHHARATLSGWSRLHGLDLCPLCRIIAENRARLASTA